MNPNPNPSAVTPEEFDEIDAILDDLRNRYDETPQWEFCEGFLAALVCCRRAIAPQEYFEVLLAISNDADSEGSFADEQQRSRFLQLWERRVTEVRAALDTEVKSLDEEGAYQPEVTDVRGAVAELSADERASVPAEEIPAFAQVWALGFMFAVENWPEEWVAPRDKDAAKWLDASLQSVIALTEDDTAEPEISPFSEDGVPTMSAARLDAFASAVWAVYDLREIWRSIGPRVDTVRRVALPGRNDPCSCGSGKKYKKCCGSTTAAA
jgi:uncharacterized protein